VGEERKTTGKLKRFLTGVDAEVIREIVLIHKESRDERQREDSEPNTKCTIIAAYADLIISRR